MPPVSTQSARGVRMAHPRTATYTHAQKSDHCTDRLWKQYWESPTEQVRNRLLERYLFLVRYNAERIHQRLPDEVDIDDLIQAGYFGLVDAIDAFNSDKGVKFETYCAPRIRGSILDELRAMDWVPRLVRHRTARVEQARQRIEMELGRKATDQEIAARLQLDKDEFEKFNRDSRTTQITSITHKVRGPDKSRETRDIDIATDEDQDNPIHAVQRKDLKKLITHGLTAQERLVVLYYYYHSFTMKEIGDALGLSESRVSQMHSSILTRLKAQMQYRMRELEPMQ